MEDDLDATDGVVYALIRAKLALDNLDVEPFEVGAVPGCEIVEHANLVDDAVASLTNTLSAQKQTLDGWQSTRGDDTEVMRVALRNYRDFLDRLLGL